MDFINNVPFDPGFTKHLENFTLNINYVYETLNKIKNFNMKKFQFNKFYPIVLKDFDKYINFYVGCMLWAIFLKQFENKEITGNHAFGQDLTEDAGLFQTKFIQDFIPKFEKDTKYYLNKPLKIEADKIKILDIYTEFLIQNESFTKTKNTNDIKLPFEAKTPDYELILKTIENVCESGNFDKLYDLRGLILNSAV